MADARVIHFEIVGKDGAALQRYYAGLFGWSIDDNHPGGYGMTDPTATGPVVGIGTAPDGSGGWGSGYVTGDDIDATLAPATALGGAGGVPKVSPGGHP